MAEAVQDTRRKRRRLPCGAVTCGGCVKECGVVVYRYIAGLEEEDDREDPVLSGDDELIQIQAH